MKNLSNSVPTSLLTNFFVYISKHSFIGRNDKSKTKSILVDWMSKIVNFNETINTNNETIELFRDKFLLLPQNTTDYGAGVIATDVTGIHILYKTQTKSKLIIHDTISDTIFILNIKAKTTAMYSGDSLPPFIRSLIEYEKNKNDGEVIFEKIIKILTQSSDTVEIHSYHS